MGNLQRSTSERVSRPSTGAISKNRDMNNPMRGGRPHSQLSSAVEDVGRKRDDDDDDDVIHEEGGGTPWTVVGEKKRQQRKHRLQKDGEAGRPRGPVMGSKKGFQQLRAVKRTADVFLGRIDNVVSVDDIHTYVSENFKVKLCNVEELTIKAKEYKAFKLTLDFNEREKLFNSELWPENVVVDKFYNRSKK